MVNVLHQVRKTKEENRVVVFLSALACAILVLITAKTLAIGAPLLSDSARAQGYTVPVEQVQLKANVAKFLPSFVAREQTLAEGTSGSRESPRLSCRANWGVYELLDMVPREEPSLEPKPDVASPPCVGPNPVFDFRQELFGSPSTLSASVQEIDTATGYVLINGGDSKCPTTPFTFNWGDGSVEEGWFPKEHVYDNVARNYVVEVTAHYSDGGTNQGEIVVRFAPPVIDPVGLPTKLFVSIPNHPISLSSRLYPPPSDLTYFGDDFFNVVPRASIEYVLTIAAWIQYDFVDGNIFLVDNAFRQVVLRDPSSGGMYSLWFANPVSLASGDYGFRGTLEYSSFFHEMGHNMTLNSPADYYYGGRIDGCATAMFSESMAQIFQHATAYELLNTYKECGLSDDLMAEIKQSAISSIRILRSAYEDYLQFGTSFQSWNDPSTPEDETFGTFMTIAYKFCAHAEQAGRGYRTPLKRMMKLLQLFDASLKDQYDQHNDTPQADAFRATLMVTALSYAFSTDLRTEFRNLNFPIDDDIYEALYAAAVECSVNLENAGWHMITLPGELCDTEVDLLSALSDDIDPCYISHYDPGVGDYVMAPPGENIEYYAGMGFWVRTYADDVTIDAEVQVPTEAVNIPLGSGWNQIGNPFNFAVPANALRVRCGDTELSLTDAQAQGWVSAYLFGYDTTSGGYVMVDPTNGCLQSWNGYWMRSYREGCELTVPPTACSAAALAGESMGVKELQERGLELSPLPPPD